MDMGEDRIYETIRFWTMSVAEYLDEYFETDVIKASLSGSGIIEHRAVWEALPSESGALSQLNAYVVV